MKSIMHRIEVHVCYMTLRGLNFESCVERYFVVMYEILVDIVKSILRCITLPVGLCSCSLVILWWRLTCAIGEES